MKKVHLLRESIGFDLKYNKQNVNYLFEPKQLGKLL